MTEYKEGQDVLVRAKVKRACKDAWCPKLIFNGGGGQRVALCIQPGEIYSLAPEFNVGEMIEVSNTGFNDDWMKDKFSAYDNLNANPYICERRRWQYARKIEPKDKDVTAEEIRGWDCARRVVGCAFWDDFIKHFDGRRIAGGKDE